MMNTVSPKILSMVALAKTLTDVLAVYPNLTHSRRSDGTRTIEKTIYDAQRAYGISDGGMWHTDNMRAAGLALIETETALIEILGRCMIMDIIAVWRAAETPVSDWQRGHHGLPEIDVYAVDDDAIVDAVMSGTIAVPRYGRQSAGQFVAVMAEFIVKVFNERPNHLPEMMSSQFSVCVALTIDNGDIATRNTGAKH